jgi:uncharacterized protein involved in exopolysaccharide biosynthesis
MDAIQAPKLPAKDLRAILSRRKWQILITFSLILAAVALITAVMPRKYQTRMKFLVKNERADMVVSAGNNAQASLPGEVSETQINTEIELLNNNDLLRQVVIACRLDRLETANGKTAEERGEVAVERAVRRLQRGLDITPVRRASIVEVRYTAGDPHQALEVLQRLAEFYLEAHLRVHGTPGTFQFFLSQTAHYKSELRAAEEKLADFRRHNNIVLFAQQKEEIQRRLSDSVATLLAAEAAIREYSQKVADARSQLAAAEPRVITQSRTISNQYSVERLGTMLVELQNKRTLLLSKFRSDDRLVQEASQEIADTQAALDRAKVLTGSDQATDVNPVRQTLELDLSKGQAELAGIEARREVLLQQTETYRRDLANLDSSTAEYDDLMRTQKEAEDNYLLYARKSEEARIADSLDKQKIANVTIAESPVEPHLPATPNVPLNLALGTLLAMFVSLSAAFSAEYLQQPRVIRPEAFGNFGPVYGESPLLEIVENTDDLEGLTGLPVLAVARRF